MGDIYSSVAAEGWLAAKDCVKYECAVFMSYSCNEVLIKVHVWWLMWYMGVMSMFYCSVCSSFRENAVWQWPSSFCYTSNYKLINITLWIANEWVTSFHLCSIAELPVSCRCMENKFSLSSASVNLAASIDCSLASKQLQLVVEDVTVHYEELKAQVSVVWWKREKTGSGCVRRQRSSRNPDKVCSQTVK